MHDMRLDAVLPAALEPYRTARLTRYGQKNDCGYLIESADVDKSDCLVSLGIGQDWSFDIGFCAQNDCPVFAYDGSVSARKFLNSAIRKARFPWRWRAARDQFVTWQRFRVFFQGKRRHFRQHVGVPASDSVSFRDIIDQIRGEGLARPFVKIDIEGAEYRLLDDILSAADMTTGLAIEFHDCDLHLSRIVGFVNAYPLALVHIHANNYQPISEQGVPLCLELTFSSSCDRLERATLPNPQDSPNKHGASDYKLLFDR